MDDAPIRNPSPPSEDFLSGDDKSLLEADTIENTVFSKHWVFSILMKLLEQVENEPKKASDGASSAEDHGIDIDDELENDLCRLWDMTANVEVSKFLQEWKSPDIFLSVISKTNAPRITEICMGVLGNMACCPAIRREFSKNQQLVDLGFSLMSGSDAPTMVETSRLIYTCLNDEECAPRWLEKVKKDGEVFKSVTFILQSSTNSDLIHNVADVLDQLLDLDDGLLQTWSGPVLIQAITEALNQVSPDRPNTVSLLLHSLQVISTTDSGVDGLAELCEKVLPLVTSFISEVVEEDGVLVMRGRENTLASVISVLAVMVLRSKDVSSRLSEKGSRTIKQLAEMLYVFHRKKEASSSRKPSLAEDPTSSRHSSQDSRKAEASSKNDNRDSNTTNDNEKSNERRADGDGGKHEGCCRDEEETEKEKKKEKEKEKEKEVDEVEEDQEAVWLTELLKDQLIDFFCCALEVAKNNAELKRKFQSCGQARLKAMSECLPDDRNDLMDLMETIQAKS